MNVRQIPLRFIRRDGGTQARAAMDQAAITEYAEAMEAGASFPAVILFQDQDTYWLGDGFHRVAAAEKAGKKNIKAEIRVGTQRDARLHALGANVTHGIRRTNADKRLAVSILLDDPEWGAWPIRKIAEHAGVTHWLVNEMKKTGVEGPTAHSFGNADSETVTDPQEIHRQMEDVEAEQGHPPAPRLEAEEAPDSGARPALAQTTASDQGQPPTGEDEPNPGLSREGMLELEKAREEIAELKRKLEEAGLQLQEVVEENLSLHRILDAEDLLASYQKEVKRVAEMNRVLESRKFGLMDENADLTKRLKAAQRKIERLEKAAQAAAPDEEGA